MQDIRIVEFQLACARGQLDIVKSYIPHITPEEARSDNNRELGYACALEGLEVEQLLVLNLLDVVS